MIHDQMMYALGYKGAVWRHDDRKRHIQISNTKTLCGLKLRKAKMIMKSGRFQGYMIGSCDVVHGFYGTQRCKECLERHLRHRLSDRGKLMLRQAKAREYLRIAIQRV